MKQEYEDKEVKPLEQIELLKSSVNKSEKKTSSHKNRSEKMVQVDDYISKATIESCKNFYDEHGLSDY